MVDTPDQEQKIKANAAKERASLAGATHEPPPPGESMKKGKFLPKNKHRLPRREKKAQKKAAGRL